ncbi:hypothetical protein G647_05781 [Cladophialophora carrionii CBS 160.54]|uniref:Secreted protein n=1 Tax=Cladophialophora carrionii CBS 160.54 TaxID=1279043 RepID=V9DAP2_9EURO|nr:uncharacterized protein G647_05781 [Cladophialophora carrionii CBS 160.54]ETI23974.1 hypothetical protein G647_05781 [Cladophialophora carrionii CBS 160.54]
MRALFLPSVLLWCPRSRFSSWMVRTQAPNLSGESRTRRTTRQHPPQHAQSRTESPPGTIKTVLQPPAQIVHQLRISELASAIFQTTSKFRSVFPEG